MILSLKWMAYSCKDLNVHFLVAVLQLFSFSPAIKAHSEMKRTVLSHSYLMPIKL